MRKPVPDAELVRRCAEGDDAAWTLLTERYADLVHATARSYGLAGAAASDVVQQTFLALLSNLRRLRKPESLAAWIARTARSAACHEIRKARSVRRWDRAAARGEVAPDPPPPDVAASLETQHVVRRAFGALGERCRRLLDALFLSAREIAYDEVAADLGLARGSIGSLRQRCLAELRDLLLELGYRPESERASPAAEGKRGLRGRSPRRG